MRISKLYSIFLKHPIICTDSRNIVKGSIFFALKGEKFNGNKFVLEAFKKGCVVAITDDKKNISIPKTIVVNNSLETLQNLAKHHRKNLNIPIIGITGTNGKTTSKELINSVLKTQLNAYATKGNLNNHIGVPLSILNINQKHEIAIIEMGANHKNEIKFLCDIAQPTNGIITNIGIAHLEGFGSFEGIIRAKNELYQFIYKNKGHVFVNNSDKLLRNLASKIKQTKYGKNTNINGTIIKSKTFINIKYKNLIIKSNLIGAYQINNILLSICIGDYFKINLKNIKKAIEGYIPSNNRSQIINTKKNIIILDAYNANPSSMRAMIESFFKQDFKNKFCILGDMLELGENSFIEHKKIVDMVEKINIESVFIGKEFNKITTNSFINITEYENILKEKPLENKTILLKGSRGLTLEKLTSLL